MEGRGTKRFLRRKGGNHGEVMCLDDSMARASEVVGGTPSSWINGVRSSTTFFDLGSLPTIQQLCENRRWIGSVLVEAHRGPNPYICPRCSSRQSSLSRKQPKAASTSSNRGCSLRKRFRCDYLYDTGYHRKEAYRQFLRCRWRRG